MYFFLFTYLFLLTHKYVFDFKNRQVLIGYKRFSFDDIDYIRLRTASNDESNRIFDDVEGWPDDYFRGFALQVAPKKFSIIRKNSNFAFFKSKADAEALTKMLSRSINTRYKFNYQDPVRSS